MRSRFRPWRPCSRPARPWWRGLRGARRAVAALEFALTTPVLIFLLFGMYDLSMGWITWQRLETATSSVGQVATMLAVQTDGTNWLGTLQAWQAATAINAAMPETRLSGAQYAVVLSEVTFAADPSCGQASDGTPIHCIATVLWSKVVLFQGNTAPTTRPCGQQNHLSDTASPDKAALPDSLFKELPTHQNPTLVVDVTYTFTPLFLSGLLGSFPMTYAVYYPSRFGDDPTGAGQVIGYGDIVDAQGRSVPDTTGTYCPSPSAPPSATPS